MKKWSGIWIIKATAMGVNRSRSALILILVVWTLCCSSPDRETIETIPGTIAVYGDSRTKHDVHREVVEAMCQVDPLAVFHTGDLVEDGWNLEQWEIFNEIIAPLLAVVDFYPALGNHEANSPYYFENFILPGNERWYVVDLQGIHFIILDSNFPLGIESDQYRWLENDLRKMADSDLFLIVLFHHPPFSSGSHAEDEMGLRQTVVPLFEASGVDIVFNGHDHFYERSLVNAVYYIVTGGGGAPLHDSKRENPYSQVFFKEHHFCRLVVDDHQLKIEVFTRNLLRIDSFTVIK